MKITAQSPMPVEEQAYALARYSRSSDSFEESLAWVKFNGGASKFLEKFYFQYGHASVADLGHMTMTFEGISELAAIELEDEQLWDGQQRSTRYQNFNNVDYVVPDDIQEKDTYRKVVDDLYFAYRVILGDAKDYLAKENPRPPAMKVEDYERALNARSFDVARYCLPLSTPTSVGQVTSIRTLERQIRRLLASPRKEIRDIANQMITAAGEQVPTLAKYLVADTYSSRIANLDFRVGENEQHIRSNGVQLVRNSMTDCLNLKTDIAASLCFSYQGASYEDSYSYFLKNPKEERSLIESVLALRGKHESLPREFQSAPLIFEIAVDIGAYRDLHRHRRCVQLSRKPFGENIRSYEIPKIVNQLKHREVYVTAMKAAINFGKISVYALPFAARDRFIFKMDFAQADYISKLRSGVKGHPSYRKIAWQMRETLAAESWLGNTIQATPPWIEEPLTR